MTLREKLEDIDNECRDCPAELAEAALGIIRLKLRNALQDVARLEVYAELLDPKSSLWRDVKSK